MASVEKRVRPGADGRAKTTWLVRWRDTDGKQRKKSYERKVDAERWRAQVATDLARGAYVDLTNPITVTDYVRRYVATRAHRSQTSRRVASYIKNHIEPTALGRKRMVAVLPSDVQGWVSERSQHLQPSTLKSVLAILRAAFTAAVLDKVIPSSPAVKLTVAPAAKKKVVPLTIDQVEALAEALPEQYQALVIVQAGLGLRVGELFALRVQDVDFLRRTVRIEEQIDLVTRERVPPKTASSVRTLPLPKVVSEALAAHLKKYPATESGLIFHTATGLPINRSTYPARRLTAAVAAVNARAAREAAEVEAGSRAAALAPVPADTSTHDFRHHFASVLLAAGESVVAVAERLGHENATLVLTTYAHLMPNSDERTRKAIDDAWTDRAPKTASAPTVPQAGQSGS